MFPGFADVPRQIVIGYSWTQASAETADGAIWRSAETAQRHNGSIPGKSFPKNTINRDSIKRFYSSKWVARQV
jgi:hypothetical protein